MAAKLKASKLSIGYLTALVPEELMPVEEVLESSEWAKVASADAAPELDCAGIAEWTKTLGGQEVVAYTSSVGMGQTASAIETMAFLQRCQPDIVILVGIAGSLDHTRIHKRDVVAGMAVHWRMQNRVKGEAGKCDVYRKKTYSCPPIDADAALCIRRVLAKSYPPGGAFTVHAGDIFSWDYVIDGDPIVQRVLEDCNSSLCVEMEGGAYLSSIARHNKISKPTEAEKKGFLGGGLSSYKEVEGYVVRGISDYARQKDKDPQARLDASRNAALVALSIGDELLRRRILRL